MIEIKNLSKSFKRKKVLNDISFALKEGTICGLFGVNGAGKSTLMKIICGLEVQDKGNVYKDGKVFVPGVFPKIGSMIESPCFFNSMTAIDNLRLLTELAGEGSEDDIAYALKSVGLYEKANILVSRYSLGMKQRLYFATCLLRDSDFFLLDEPFNGIDPIALKSFEELIKKMASKGKTFIISSHEIRELQALVDKAVFLDNGKIIYENDNASGIDVFDEFLARVNHTGDAQ
jgi:ABC-type multidrug transport system ATPase subunit